MSYTPEQFARLPKWAQREIEDHERRVANLKVKIEELNSDHPDSNIKVTDYIHGDRGIPPDSEIDFYLGDGRQKWCNVITVQHLRTKDRKVLRVYTGGGTLTIRPSAPNVIEITTEGR